MCAPAVTVDWFAEGIALSRKPRDGKVPRSLEKLLDGVVDDEVEPTIEAAHDLGKLTSASKPYDHQSASILMKETRVLRLCWPFEFPEHEFLAGIATLILFHVYGNFVDLLLVERKSSPLRAAFLTGFGIVCRWVGIHLPSQSLEGPLLIVDCVPHAL
ncbi:unnamed protein product [Sphagnum balticum]